MVGIYISIGSNISPEKNVRTSLIALENQFDTLKLSPIYRSSAVGFDGPDFLNLVVASETEYSVSEVNNRLLEIENRQNRDRARPKFSDRTLDLDLLLYGEEEIDNGQVEIPRPEIEDQIFVLQPLTDLMPNMNHPVLNYTFADMLDNLHKSNPESINALMRVTL